MLKRWSTVGAVLLLAVAMTVVPAAAKKGGTDRPFKADLTGQVTFDFGPDAAARCGPYAPGAPMSVLTYTDAVGRATHLGKVEAAFWHCPRDFGHDNGHLTLTAANGDELHIEYVDDGTSDWSFPVHVVGGTGRFDGASGALTLYYGLEPAVDPAGEPDFSTAWGWWGTLEGSISY